MLQLAAALDRTRIETLAAFTSEGPILDYARDLNVSAMVVPMESAFFYSAHVPLSSRMLIRFGVHYRSSVKTAETLVREFRPDVVHLNTSVLLPVAVGVKRAGAKLVWHVREAAGPNPILRRWMVRQIQKFADHIVVTSEYVGRTYMGAKPVTVLHNALDGDRFSPCGEAERKTARAELNLPAHVAVVGIIGSVQEAKGHSVLVRAAKKVVQLSPEFRFLVVAGGVPDSYSSTLKGGVKRLLGLPNDNLERMRSMVAQSGLSANFVFCGFQSDIPKVISAMDVLVFPSLIAEGFGRPIIEGMAVGCPVVASDIGPSREIAGDAAVFVSPGNPDELAGAILTMLRDPEKARQLSQAGRRRFLERFEMKLAVGKLESVYQQVLNRQSTPVVA